LFVFSHLIYFPPTNLKSAFPMGEKILRQFGGSSRAALAAIERNRAAAEKYDGALLPYIRLRVAMGR